MTTSCQLHTDPVGLFLFLYSLFVALFAASLGGTHVEHQHSCGSSTYIQYLPEMF